MGERILRQGEPKEETPEEKSAREKRLAEAEARRIKQEEAIRLAVPRDIERLRKEAADRVAEADRLEAVFTAYPNLRKRVGRWDKVAYYSKDVNSKVEQFDLRHNCGCCNDSPLEIWPYLSTPFGKIYSDPPEFRVGEKSDHGGDRPYSGWDDTMKAAGISDVVIRAVVAHFERCAQEAREALDAEYGDG